MNTEYEISSLNRDINDLKTQRDFLLKHEAFLKTLPDRVGVFTSCGSLHFKGCEHEDTIALIKHFGGKWNKTYDGQRSILSYVPEGYNIDGASVMIYNAKPPSSCRIVEETVHVPAHDEVRRRVVCEQPMEAVAA